MGRLQGKRVVVTQADAFMGRDIAALFRREGAAVVEDERDLRDPGAAGALIAEAGEVDVLVANLAAPVPRTSVADTSDEVFRAMYEAMVFPLHRLVRAVLPQMIARRRGKVVVVGSASALRGSPNYCAYASARGAQLSYVQAVGVEIAPHNVQVNAIAQTFVENPTYFPPDYQRTEEFEARLGGAPAGRLAHGWESAALALFLAGDESDFFVGQIFPFAGGWVTR
jgi:2-keto-3-deoxy-L-fuconate dehydrogenase